jgi:NTP pyrophosphatase (non-canonical NTP hydrolase)
MKLYLAGPMTGYPNFNFPAFHAAAAKLRAEGNEVFNPAERDLVRDGKDWGNEVPSGDAVELASKGFSKRVALADDLAYICGEADGVALLPGWEKSTGATAERATAIALGLDVIELLPRSQVEFTSLRHANAARHLEWDPEGKIGLAFRGVELAGETGEACNVIKKLVREDMGLRGPRDTVAHLAEELADVVICAHLTAMTAEIDLDAAVRDKFNDSSEKNGLSVRLVA